MFISLGVLFFSFIQVDFFYNNGPFLSLRRIKSGSDIYSGQLHRITEGPLLQARPDAKININGKEVQWERLVYNPAAVKIDGVTYLLYRALGNDGISRIGLWWSEDGITESGRLDYPVFGPEENYECLQDIDIEKRRADQLSKYGTIREVGGVEDPRITIVGEYLYMTYTAYGEIPQIAAARIKIKDFLSDVKEVKPYQGWKDSWERLGIIRTGEDKDAVIISPGSSSEGLLLIHRISPPDISPPDMQIVPITDKAQIDDVDNIGNVFMQPREGMWDSEKIGAGTTPVKTEYGWLQIYHGVGIWNGRRAYRLGVVLTDLNDPSKIIYRSLNPVFEPQANYEKYGWVNDVVFTCGAVPRNKNSNDIFGRDDEILVYYGGADEVIGVASAKISELIPEKFLNP